MRGPQEKWLTIVEYSTFKKISVSTIRRYIKANRVQYRLDDGKYLIYCPNYVDDSAIINEDLQLISELEAELRALKKENQTLKAETHDMRMLIELYEEQLRIKKKKIKTTEDEIPEIPKI
mgnify:CR=1 FL=1